MKVLKLFQSKFYFVGTDESKSAFLVLIQTSTFDMISLRNIIKIYIFYFYFY